jgi:acyl-CoA synthetase (NDP forming)
MSLQPIPQGHRIGLITNTGGPGIQAVDQAVDSGLVLSSWSKAGRERLKQSLYAEASLGNPVDVVATAGPEHFHAAVDTLLHEEGVDMVMIYFVTAPFVDLPAIATRIKEATVGSDKPVVCVVCTIDKWAALISQLRGSGIPVYQFAEDAVRSLAGMARYQRLRDRPVAGPAEIRVDRAQAEAIVGRFSGKDVYLPQLDAFALLQSYGIAVPRTAAVVAPGDLATAAAKVGFPCVLKVDSPEVVHKSDAGGVALGLADDKALAAAFDAMRARFSSSSAYVLLEHKPAGREVIVGSSFSPGLGQLVMFGLGGVFVEVMKDVVFGVAPLTDPEADEMMREIKGLALLEGVRGQPAADLGALRELLVRAARLAADFPNIVEMDLNPIFAYPLGTPPVAVDVRIRVR